MNDHPTNDLPAISPARSAADLEQLAVVISLMTERGSEKLTMRQCLFFLAAAYLDLRNVSVNIAKIREIYPTIGRSIEKSKEQLLEPTKHTPDALGWLSQEMDEDDRRQRWLKLTPKGRKIVEDISIALRS